MPIAMCFQKEKTALYPVASVPFRNSRVTVSIQLKNGRRYDLRPSGNQPGNYRNQIMLNQ